MSHTVCTYIISIVCGVLVLGCISQEEHQAALDSLKLELEQKSAGERDEFEARVASLKKDKEALAKEIAALQNDLKWLATQRDDKAEAVEQANRRLDTFRKMLEKFRAMIEDGKIRVCIVNNRMVVEMASEILFASGSARLTRGGKEALAEVAQVLVDIQDRIFQVAGHTDDVPIHTEQFSSNWMLSSARAVSVLEHLVARGVPRTNLSAAGYADTQPVGNNDTPEGQAQNRRIEIVLQPALEELPDLSSLEKMSQ